MGRLFVLGAGGHARAAIETARNSVLSALELLVVDLAPGPRTEPSIMGVRVLRGAEALVAEFRDDDLVVLAVGDNAARRDLFEAHRGRVAPAIVHRRAICSETVRLGHGSQVLAGAILGACVQVGENTIVNSGAVIEHESVIGAHVHVAPGARIAGRVRVGDGCFLGIGSTVIDSVSVPAGCVIGAGAVVVRSIAEPGTYIGVPARRKGE
jgi:sugar O-acyltransferase (sialic acid O-acetyltransferase NeuD family)